MILVLMFLLLRGIKESIIINNILIDMMAVQASIKDTSRWLLRLITSMMLEAHRRLTIRMVSRYHRDFIQIAE
jgi:hypothetical protein